MSNVIILKITQKSFNKLVQSIFPLKMDVHTFVSTNSNLISNKLLVL